MEKNASMRCIPSIDALLKHDAITTKIDQCNREIVLYAARDCVEKVRKNLTPGKPSPSIDVIVGDIIALVDVIISGSLKPIINATGIVLHTNLGRAMLGKKVLSDITPIILGYSTIEFDCATARRGSRSDHIAQLLKYLTHAEDAIVVNNNAAAIVLALSTFAKKKDVLVSRGELIEIGGEFRIPEIMAASGARMIEVGTTNRTRCADYENALSERTAVVFKAHQSNFSMNGFVEEATIGELSLLAKKHGLLLIYDIGSGLLRKPDGLSLGGEPDVASSIDSGADLVLFSADKLLGGPQAGIIAGRSDLISRLAKAPLMRALRVGKLTLAALISACRSYLDNNRLLYDNPTFAMLSRSPKDLEQSALLFKEALRQKTIESIVVENIGQCGGGTLPDVALPGFAVKLIFAQAKKSLHKSSAEAVFKKLLALENPILGILREGALLFDLRTVDDNEIPRIADAISGEINRLP